jgi:hypothetical protein
LSGMKKLPHRDEWPFFSRREAYLISRQEDRAGGRLCLLPLGRSISP